LFKKKLVFIDTLSSVFCSSGNVFHALNGHNRWFDTCLTVIVSNDGRCGMNGEHSPLDALIPAWVFGNALDKYVSKYPLVFLFFPFSFLCSLNKIV